MIDRQPHVPHAIVATFDKTTGASIRLLMAARGWSADWRPRLAASLAVPDDAFGDAFLCEARTASDAAMLARFADRHPRRRVAALVHDQQPDWREAASHAVDLIDLPVEPERLSRFMTEWEQARARPPRLDAIDRQVVADLSSLGGASFVRQALGQFAEDAEELAAALRDAYRRQDLEGFGDKLHALRSCAANVGAHELFTICLSMRAMSASDLTRDGSSALRRIEAEFARIRSELLDLRLAS